MEDTKPAIASSGVWGGVIALAAALAPAVLTSAGVRAPEDQQAVVSAGFQLISGIGAAVAVYGRIRATKRIA